MYCRYCGKELPNDSNFCPNCGADQNLSKNKSSRIRISEFINNQKVIIYVYLTWILLHITLFISSSKDNSAGFYPWNKPLNDMLSYLGGGKPSYFSFEYSWFDKYNVYDISEFFFYTILLPLLLVGLVKLFPSFFTKAKMLRIRDKVLKYKVILVVYALWCITHIIIYIISPSEYYSKSDFYPFNDTLSDVLNHGIYICSLTYIEAYDSSELFFYVILMPVVILCILCFGHYFLRKIKVYNTKRQIDNTKNIQECKSDIKAYKSPSSNKEIVTNLSDEISNTEENDDVFTMINNSEMVHQDEQEEIEQPAILAPETDKSENQPLTVDEINNIPFLQRLVGSLIDKILILVLFVVGYMTISPYGAAGKLGTYFGLRSTSPSTYEYIDRINMNKYQSGLYFEYYDDIDKDFQDKARQTEEPPHIGSTLELDMKITISFILLNLIYYILFECLYAASPGKRLWGGIIIDGKHNRIGYGKVLARALFFAILMLFTVYILHLQFDLCNSIVVIIFFLLMDIPVLITKRSLLDMCTGTTYAKL